MDQLRKARNGLRLQLAANTTTLRAVECGSRGAVCIGERGRGCTRGRALGGESLCRPTTRGFVGLEHDSGGTTDVPYTRPKREVRSFLASLLLPRIMTVVAVCHGRNSRSSNTLSFTQGAGWQRWEPARVLSMRYSERQ